jgi:phasin family protein
MTFPDPLSEASKQQLAKQIEFFQALTSRAFDNAERILALNIQTTRATLDHTSGAVRQLAEARHPGDFAALGTQSQQQMEAVIAYGRKLMEITNKPATPAAAPQPEPAPKQAGPAPAQDTTAPDDHIDTAPPVMVAEPAAPDTPPEPLPDIAAAAEPEPAPEPEAPQAADPAPADDALTTLPPPLQAAPSAHPLAEADAEPVPAPAIPDARPTPIAQAVSEVAAMPLDIPHPAAVPVLEMGLDADAPIAIPAIAPVDATPPQVNSSPAPVEGGGPAKRTKGAKKR